MKSVLYTILLFATLLLLPACRSSGSLDYERTQLLPDGRTIQEQLNLSTPQHPAKPGRIVIGPLGEVDASTGSEPPTSAASRSLGKLPWLGGLLLVGGILAVVLKAKIPLIPAELGIGLAISGLLLMVLPSLIEAYLNYILLGLIGTAVVITIYRVNRLRE